MRLLAIDPGNTESGIAVVDTTDCAPIYVAKLDNHTLLQMIVRGSDLISADRVVIEGLVPVRVNHGVG